MGQQPKARQRMVPQRMIRQLTVRLGETFPRKRPPAARAGVLSGTETTSDRQRVSAETH